MTDFRRHIPKAWDWSIMKDQSRANGHDGGDEDERSSPNELLFFSLCFSLFANFTSSKASQVRPRNLKNKLKRSRCLELHKANSLDQDKWNISCREVIYYRAEGSIKFVYKKYKGACCIILKLPSILQMRELSFAPTHFSWNGAHLTDKLECEQIDLEHIFPF